MDFEERIERGEDSEKWCGAKAKEELPLWVADMDFACSDAVIRALQKRVDERIYGYTTGMSEAYKACVRAYYRRHFNWDFASEDLFFSAGVVQAVSLLIHLLSKEGDAIVIQTPVYHPFRIVPSTMRREVVFNPLKEVDGTYEMDFDHLESVIDERCKVLILCNPHNPGGIVWPKETLERLAEICARHHILVISDEIHAEMAYPRYKHHPFATVSEAAASCALTFMAPSKTFNIPGIVTSYSIIPDERIRERFYAFLEAGEFGDGTLFAYTATVAAYTYGAEWLQQMRMYVMENVRFVDEYLKLFLPKIKVYQPQASFLVWLDCRELGLSQEALVRLFKEEAGLALNDGSMFGPGGEGHMRLNVGCPRSVLKTALDKLKTAMEKK